jgi:ADP-L-glycero-D-manno-heptose 6-epimerase
MHDLSDGRILVTGGAGFIGSALIWELNRRGLSNVLVADHLRTTEKWRNLVPLRYDDYVEASALESLVDQRSSLLDDVRTVFHLGACSATTETDAAYLIHNNYEYTKKLAAWCLEREARFVYASSAATYGGLEEGLNETRPLESLRPLNMYGYSKHMFDCYAQKHGFLDKIAGLKFFNVYGPNEDHKEDMRSVVHKAYHQILETGSVSLFKSYRPEFADGCQRRDFLYVKDAVRMTIFLAQNADIGGLYNLGTGSSRTWLDLATAIFAALGREPNINFIDMPERLKGKYQYFTQAEIGKLRAAGYRNDVTSVEDAVKDYVVNYLATGSKLEP